jgi:Cu+-exporting ATPase
VDTILLDKTGTVTTGRMTVVDVVPVPGFDRAELLRLAGAVEAGSEHPLGRAITAAATSIAVPGGAVPGGAVPGGAAPGGAAPGGAARGGARRPGATPGGATPGAAPGGVTLPGATRLGAIPGGAAPADGTSVVAPADGTSVVAPVGATRGSAPAESAGPAVSLPPVGDFRATAGVGVRGVVEGRTVEVGRGTGETARTWVEVRVDGTVRGRIALADAVRPTSATAVADLRRLGLEPILLTGDSPEVAAAVAAEVGITEVIAGVLPAGKVDAVKRLQGEGRSVAMVGDGVNDAAALAQADLGLAMGAGTDVAIEASDLTLVRDDLTAAVDAVRLSRRTLSIIRGNLFWAFAYNVAALPLAAAGLLNPMIAGGAMALSSIFVVLNSLRLRRFRALRPA